VEGMTAYLLMCDREDTLYSVNAATQTCHSLKTGSENMASLILTAVERLLL
jgi:hypothetical protein